MISPWGDQQVAQRSDGTPVFKCGKTGSFYVVGPPRKNYVSAYSKDLIFNPTPPPQDINPYGPTRRTS